MQQPWITVVDDDEAVQDSLRAVLESCGYQVRTYSSGPELLARPDHASHGCLILDINLPRMNGWEILDRLRERGQRAPTILISGLASADTLKQAKRSPAIGLVEKPIDTAKLLALVAQALAGCTGTVSGI